MNWRHRIAVVMLICLAALPLAGTVCAMTCLSGTSAAATHHQDGQDCESAMPASESSESSGLDAKIGALSAYHCGTHDAALPQVAATDVKRADRAVMAAPATSNPVDPLFGSVDALGFVSQYAPPPGTAPPTSTPLVLRV